MDQNEPEQAIAVKLWASPGFLWGQVWWGGRVWQSTCHSHTDMLCEGG
jgi:hypothetical protein